MGRKPRFQSEALKYLHDRFVGDDPEKVASYEAALANAEVARDIYRLRAAAGLTQAALAKLVGTTASVICRLEDSEYEGHSLSMLRRVAAALGRRVELRFPPVKEAPSKAAGGEASPRKESPKKESPKKVRPGAKVGRS